MTVAGFRRVDLILRFVRYSRLLDQGYGIFPALNILLIRYPVWRRYFCYCNYNYTVIQVNESVGDVLVHINLARVLKMVFDCSNFLIRCVSISSCNPPLWILSSKRANFREKFIFGGFDASLHPSGRKYLIDISHEM